MKDSTMDAAAQLPEKWRKAVRDVYGQGPAGAALLHCADELEAALTQQQGGEQEARELLAASFDARGLTQDAMALREEIVIDAHTAAALDAITAALRTKQPAASEGDVLKFVRDLAENGLRYGLDPCHDWTSKETIFAFWRSYMSQADKSIRDRAAAALATNTSKQAAGEAVREGCGLCGGFCNHPEEHTPPRHHADEGMAIHACTCATERDRELCMDKQSCRVTFPLAGTP